LMDGDGSYLRGYYSLPDILTLKKTKKENLNNF